MTIFVMRLSFKICQVELLFDHCAHADMADRDSLTLHFLRNLPQRNPLRAHDDHFPDGGLLLSVGDQFSRGINFVSERDFTSEVTAFGFFVML